MARPAGQAKIGLVQKVAGKSLIADEEIARLSGITGELTQEQLDVITADVLANIDLSGKVDKVTGSSLVQDTEIAKIHSLGSDDQVIPDELSDLIDNATHRLVTDTEKGTWNGKESGNANIQSHVTSAHAPAGAQINADITKEEIEAKLIGELTSHSHASSGGLTQEQILRMI